MSDKSFKLVPYDDSSNSNECSMEFQENTDHSTPAIWRPWDHEPRTNFAQDPALNLIDQLFPSNIEQNVQERTDVSISNSLDLSLDVLLSEIATKAVNSDKSSKTADFNIELSPQPSTSYQHVDEMLNDVLASLFPDVNVNYQETSNTTSEQNKRTIMESDVEPDNDVLSMTADRRNRLKKKCKLMQEGFGQLDETQREVIEFKIVSQAPSKQNTKFKLTTKDINFQIKHNIPANVNLFALENEIDNAFGKFVSEHTKEASNEDQVFITIKNKSNADLVTHISYKKMNFDQREFLNKIAQIVQSNQDFLIDQSMEMRLQIVKNVSGTGQTTIGTLLTPETRTKSSYSVLCINNKDQFCGYYAIAVGKYLADHPGMQKGAAHNNEWRCIMRSMKRKKNMAIEMLTAINLLPTKPMDIDTLIEIEKRLENYQMIVVDSTNNSKLYVGPMREKRIFLEHVDTEAGHFNAITRLEAYMRCFYFCIKCWVKLGSKDRHVCHGTCKMCGSEKACSVDDILECLDCNQTFYNSECLSAHKDNQRCAKNTKKCEKCWAIYLDKENHTCFVYSCSRCSESYTETPHHCFMKPLDKTDLMKKDSKPKIFVFYDIESMQIGDGEVVKHQPNLLISRTVCDKCYTPQPDPRAVVCKLCKGFIKVFYGESCIKEFCDYLYHNLHKETMKSKSQIICMAHNNRGYDAHFILQDYFERKFLAAVNIIMNGSKILKFKIDRISFIDSLSFFMQPLANLPKSFNIPDAVKGHFPHLFNTRENQSYIGHLPDVSFFDADNLKPKQRDELLKWHAEELLKNNIYNFKSELIKYCTSDVNILTQAVMKFRSEFQSITELDPLTRNFTLASIGLETFRASMLSEKSLALTPIESYSEFRRHSMAADCWLDLQESLSDRKIKREFRIGTFFADGFCSETNTAYEFWGCLYHGCPECNRDLEFVKINDEFHRVSTLQKAVQRKKDFYSSNGITLIDIWEHDFKPQHGNEFVKTRIAHYKRLKAVGPASLREAFFGGRTNNIAFSYNCTDDEEIKYYDFTSLYPYVLKTGKYPTGHPNVIQDNFDYTLQSYFGFIKCKILPPSNLHIATLPTRIKHRLVFPLCRTCAEESIQGECTHDESHRALVGTWCSEELKVAIADGYKITSIYEVLHYDQTSSDLFSAYIRMWLKIKQEASGWPNWVQSDADRAKYISDYEQHEQIKLDASKIEKNDGRRTIAKLMLNSFWGKLAQNPDMVKSTYCNDYADLHKLMNDEQVSIKHIFEINSDRILVQYKHSEAKVNPGNTNVAVACFVTSYARLKLLSSIREIEQQREGRVLYFDTDSIIFTHRRGESEVKLGDYLGDLTDEIPSTKKCTKFISLGPKNYGYELTDLNNPSSTDATIKVKGIKLSSKSLQLITFEKMIAMANEYVQGNQIQIKVPQVNIRSDKNLHNVNTCYFEKVYRAVSTKRKIVNSVTRPYGYRDN